jgi:hypothetical protein
MAIGAGIGMTGASGSGWGLSFFLVRVLPVVESVLGAVMK